MVKTMLEQGHNNLGIHQASLLPDHNWYHDTSNGGILDIIMPYVGKVPIGWENAEAVKDTTEWSATQGIYRQFLTMLPTFPDYFDFTSGMCIANSAATNQCNWAKQYYGRTPQNTNDVWIAFQQTAYPIPNNDWAVKYSGWLRDYEYGLELKSTKGSTLTKSQLATTFSPAVANAYSGQARKVEVGETILLSPKSEWKGISSSASGNYQLAITYIGNTGKVKIDVGNITDGWYTEEWERENTSPAAWKIKILSPNKKANQIKITNTYGEPLYLHMVKLTIQ
jgi:hypothetical protein